MPLTTNDLDALAKGLAPPIRNFLAEQLTPIVKRLLALEQARVADKADLAAAIARKWSDANGR
jgi:hypothetical protein